ncbi:arsenosugar biosynthesis radical SAM protein ArsS [Coraliomargarita sp. SDUM461003]|uniref:Arsenosugar biosynthesis radical SAM protein ArsS n=1 Tax=Thalassobacterium maritimum TaxID=3041265 RepID=A0ABU1AVK7_9BACT|nr:arsenosugar biosynthesis radical SAM (seleno)protein ArsS [Coraliomargarita sp. SDUM461003]MDQ8208183.1 arsenosugar biosynthesis radical SAM protein ArsS [Coraliomargarita sp. SDUM461003]
MPSTLQTIPSFQDTLATQQLTLTRQSPRVLQINTGKMCNLTCVHCHVNAGPHRKEIMTLETVDRILDWLRSTSIEVVDLTGGTPEMMPHFPHLVEGVREMGREVMDRCNLTIINEPGYEWVAEFHAQHGVHIVASMPCYCPKNVNAQRGEGVFDSSIQALQTLNALGYGIDPRLKLDLVFNPNGAQLPPEQAELEADYKRELKEHFDIVFNQLFAITNMPIARFTSYLKRQGSYQAYMQLLLDNFNPASIEGLMCRDTISVGWEGDLFDCDFNQQLGMQHGEKAAPERLWELDLNDWVQRPIQLGSHCYGCTAGQGSSCGGATV